jgi:hypothetical protein
LQGRSHRLTECSCSAAWHHTTRWAHCRKDQQRTTAQQFPASTKQKQGQCGGHSKWSPPLKVQPVRPHSSFRCTRKTLPCVCVCALCCVVLQAASAQKQPSYLGRKDPPTSRTTTTATSSSSDQPSVPLKGVLELGGGSLQVTFLPEAPLPSAEASPLALPNLGSGRLYSRSFDGLGLQVRHPSGAVCFCNEILFIECFQKLLGNEILFWE